MSRASGLDVDILTMMRNAGCVCVATGIESGSERSLRKMQKGVTRDQSAEFLANVRAVGMQTRVYLVIGFPWETVDDLEDTLTFVQETTPDSITVSFATPFRGTELYEDDRLAITRSQSTRTTG